MSPLASWVYHFLQLPLLTVIPRRFGEPFSDRLAKKLSSQDPQRSVATLHAIQQVFGRSWQQTQIQDVVFGSFKTRVWEDSSAYMFRSWTSDNIDRYFEFDGLEHLEEARSRGKGGLLVGAHFGLLCGGLVAIHLKGFVVNYLANDTPDDPAFDSAVRRHSRYKIRGMVDKSGDFISFGVGRDRTSSSLATVEALGCLRRNEFVAALMDINPQSFSNTEAAQFLGHTVRFPTGFLRLAQIAGSSVIPQFTVWNDQSGKYRVLLEEPVDLTGDVKADLQSSVDRICKRVREHPSQWMAWDGLLGAVQA